MNIQENLDKYKEQLEKLEKEAKDIKNQIALLNSKGQQIAAEGNKVLGAIEALESLQVIENEDK